MRISADHSSAGGWRSPLLSAPGKKESLRDFPGSPVVSTPRFHCRGHEFDPWSGNQDPTCSAGWQKHFYKVFFFFLRGQNRCRSHQTPLDKWCLPTLFPTFPTPSMCSSRSDVSCIACLSSARPWMGPGASYVLLGPLKQF